MARKHYVVALAAKDFRRLCRARCRRSCASSSSTRPAFEGNKVMVFVGATLKDAIKWRKLDPHFRQPMRTGPEVAPPPAARFPSTLEGWKDALAWAAFRQETRTK